MDTIKSEFEAQLDGLIEELEEQLNNIKSGRASPDIFDNIEVTAYNNEKHKFSDLCQVIVKGKSNLIVKVYDEGVKEEVIKALQRSQDFDLNVTVADKDIMIKLGTSKKEFLDAALRKVKTSSDEFKQRLKDVRHAYQNDIRKLEKILPKDDVTLFQKDLEKLQTTKENEVKKLIEKKEKEVKGL